MPVPSVLADLAMPAWVTDDEGTEAFGPLAVGHEVGGLECNHVTAAQVLARLNACLRKWEKICKVCGHVNLFKSESFLWQLLSSKLPESEQG